MRTIAILLVTAAPVYAEGVSIEAKVAGNVAILTAKTEGPEVKWIAVGDGLSQVVPFELLKDTKTYVVSGKPGSYRIIAISASKDSPLWGEATFVLAGDDKPTPPPLPPVPPPPDVLLAKLQSAYTADASVGKRGQLVNLIGLYSAAADYAADDKVTTLKVLLENIRKVGGDLLQPNALVEVRRIISTEIVACIGPPGDTPLDAETRAKAAACFNRISKALQGVK